MKPKAPPAPPPDAPTVMPAQTAGPAAAPAVAPVPVMPMADDAAIAAARKKKLAKDIGRSGRLSTILSDSSETLG